jgi:hypothetical protein
LAKVDWISSVLFVISVSSVWGWAVASNEGALANARVAATECSRRRLERAEVEQFLAAYAVVERSRIAAPKRAVTAD